MGGGGGTHDDTIPASPNMFYAAIIPTDLVHAEVTAARVPALSAPQSAHDACYRLIMLWRV